MIFDWYNLFNKDDFEDADLVSRNLTFFLQDYGEKNFLITKGNYIGVTCDGIFLPLQFADKNPYSFEGRALFLDEATGNVWYGIEVEE